MKREYWGPCSSGSEVILLSVEGLDHTWPDMNNSGFNASEEIWSFLKNHTLSYGISSLKKLPYKVMATVSRSSGERLFGYYTGEDIDEMTVVNVRGAVITRWKKGEGNIVQALENIRWLAVVRLRTDRGVFVCRQVFSR